MRNPLETARDAYERGVEYLEKTFGEVTTIWQNEAVDGSTAGKVGFVAVPIEGAERQLALRAFVTSVGHAGWEVFGAMPSLDYEGTTKDLRRLYKGR